jgi:hypothetical protein
MLPPNASTSALPPLSAVELYQFGSVFAPSSVHVLPPSVLDSTTTPSRIAVVLYLKQCKSARHQALHFRTSYTRATYQIQNERNGSDVTLAKSNTGESSALSSYEPYVLLPSDQQPVPE